MIINSLINRTHHKRKSNKNIIIHHYCPHTYNAGDHFVILSIRHHIKKYLPNAVFIPLPIADNRGWGNPIGLRGPNIDFSNKHADAVILGGSDQYNDWSPRISKKEIKNLIPPLFLIGLGVSSKGLSEPPFLSRQDLKPDIIATNKKSVLSSVRDEISKEFLHELGIKNTINTGCPALFLFNRDFHLNKSNKVALTFPYPLTHTDKEKFNILISTMRDIIIFLNKYKFEPIIVCHDDRDVTYAQRYFSNEELFFSNYPSDYITFYNTVSMIIGSRLHASILASGMGIPNININLDLRGIGFSQDMKMNNWHVNYTQPNLSEIIISKIESTLNGDLQIFQTLKTNRDQKLIIFDQFIHKTTSHIEHTLK